MLAVQRASQVRAAWGAARRAARAPSMARIACQRSRLSSASPWLSASSLASCSISRARGGERQGKSALQRAGGAGLLYSKPSSRPAACRAAALAPRGSLKSLAGVVPHHMPRHLSLPGSPGRHCAPAATATPRLVSSGDASSHSASSHNTSLPPHHPATTSRDLITSTRGLSSCHEPPLTFIQVWKVCSVTSRSFCRAPASSAQR